MGRKERRSAASLKSRFTHIGMLCVFITGKVFWELLLVIVLCSEAATFIHNVKTDSAHSQ